MKKIFLMFVALLFTISMVFAANEAVKTENNDKATKDRPCVTDCKTKNKKCLNAARKTPKAQQKGKVADCEKVLKDCKANCNKPDEIK